MLRLGGGGVGGRFSAAGARRQANPEAGRSASLLTHAGEHHCAPAPENTYLYRFGSGSSLEATLV